MRTGTSQTQQPITRLDARAIKDGGFFHHADAEPRQIVISGVIHARHFRGLAADQGATGQFATTADTGNHGGGDLHIELAGGVVVQEKQRFGALHHDVVDTHRDQINANAIMPPCLDSQLELGTDAIGARHQDGLAVTVHRQFEQRAKASQSGEHPGDAGPRRYRLDAFNQSVSGVDIDAGTAVIQRRVICNGIQQRLSRCAVGNVKQSRQWRGPSDVGTDRAIVRCAILHGPTRLNDAPPQD